LNEFENKDVDAVYGDISYFNEDINKITRIWKAGKHRRKINYESNL
jgi:hypothetical protein